MSRFADRHLGFAALAGLAIAAGLPPWGWWPLTLVGLAAWFRLADHPARRTRFVRSAVVGAFWLFPATLWMYDLTAPGWPVAAGTYSLLMGVAGAVTPAGDPRRYALFPAAVALAELIRWHVPFGGVPIATIAMAAVDTPWAISARLFGSPFLVAVTIAVALAFAATLRRERIAVGLFGLVVAATIGGHLAGAAVDTVGELHVAVVQGGGPQNTRADVCENRRVFERHVEATAMVDTTEPVDLILWPEDVVHPAADGLTLRRCSAPLLYRAEAEATLARLATDAGAPIVSGWFERAPDGDANVNYALVIGPGGEIGDRYDKVRLVPFGEFVPLRSLIEVFSSEVPGLDVRSGDEPAVLETDLGTLGVSISWEIFFDYRARDAVNAGAEVLLNPTNGSSYWLTMVQTQQVASSRLRALETDRWVVQAAPTGFSAIVDDDGDVLQRTGVSEQRVLQGTIELREGRTPAVVLGPWPVLIGSVLLLGWGWRDTRRRQAHSARSVQS